MPAQLRDHTYLANHPEVDGGRIYLAGVSNGGGMVLTMGAAYPDYLQLLFQLLLILNRPIWNDKLKESAYVVIHTKADTVQPENLLL